MKEFLQGNTGQLSSKRLMGCFCIVNAVIMKYILIICFNATENLSKLDSVVDIILLAGVGLIGGGLLEKTKGEAKDDTKL